MNSPKGQFESVAVERTRAGRATGRCSENEFRPEPGLRLTS